MGFHAPLHVTVPVLYQSTGASLKDPATNIYTEDDSVAEEIVRDLEHEPDHDLSNQLKMLFPYISKAGVPDYGSICKITGCSSAIKKRRHSLWMASEKYFARQATATPGSSSSSDASMSSGTGASDLDDVRIAWEVLCELRNSDFDDELLDLVMRLVPDVRERREALDYSTICARTNCSAKNSARKAFFWEASKLLAEPCPRSSSGLLESRAFAEATNACSSQPHHGLKSAHVGP